MRLWYDEPTGVWRRVPLHGLPSDLATGALSMVFRWRTRAPLPHTIVGLTGYSLYIVVQLPGFIHTRILESTAAAVLTMHYFGGQCV